MAVTESFKSGVGIVEQIGLDVIIDQIGLIPTVIGTAILIIVLLLSFFGGRRWIARAREASRPEIASNLRARIEEGNSTEDIRDTVDEKEDDVLSEATTRIEQRGDEITGENIKKELKLIEKESEEQDEPTGVLSDKGDKAPVARMNVAPQEIETHSDYIKIHGKNSTEKYSRTMMIAPYPNRVSYGWLDKLFTGGLEIEGADVRTSYHIWPRDTNVMLQQLNKRATRLTSRIRQKKDEGKIDTIDEEQKREKINSLRERLSSGETQVYDFALYIQIVAEDDESLADGTQEVKNMFSQANARVVPIKDRQLEAFRSGAPLGQDKIRQTQIMDMQSLGTTFPFIEPTRVESTGVLFGFHYTTNSPVIVDRFQLSGHNCLISGKIGGGKSYMAKLMMWRRLMMDPEIELMIVDPVGGFGDMVEAIGGQVISIDRDTVINPLEIREGQSGEDNLDEDPYDVKIRSIMGMFKQHFGQLEKKEEGVLRRAIKYAYLEKGITKNPHTHSREAPIVQDIIEILDKWSDGKPPQEFLDVDTEMMQYVSFVDSEEQGNSKATKRKNEREAQLAHDILLGLEEFKPGGQRSNLNGRTNIDMDARVVQFDLQNVVDANNAGLIMHVMIDYLFQRAKSTSSRSLITIDEAHYMFDNEGATNALNTFIRHSRHYKSGVTLISQTVDEFMDGQVKEIYDQCDIKLLMRHEDISDKAMESLGLAPPERTFVLGAQAGKTASHSECLLLTSNNESRRLRVYSNTLEHHIADPETVNVWTMLYKRGIVDWETIPSKKQSTVRSELSQSPAAVA